MSVAGVLCPWPKAYHPRTAATTPLRRRPSHLQLPRQLLQQAPVLCELPAEAVQLSLPG
jgi:hypothetical protein